MATHCGKDGTVKIGTNVIAEVRDFTIEVTADTADDTSQSNTLGWKTFKHTWKSWTASINCFYDPSDADGQNVLVEGASVAVNLYPEGDASGDSEFSGNAIVTSITRNNPLDGIVEAAFSLQGNGPLNLGVVA